MLTAATINDRLSEIGQKKDHDVPLTETALLLGALDRPAIDIEPYERELDKLADEVGHYIKGTGEDVTAQLKLEALRQVVAKRRGFAGDEEAFDDSDAANLTRALDRRYGLPIVLGIIYIHISNRLGWTMEGIDFPGRFLVRLDHGGERLMLDPFEGLAQLDPPDLRGLIKAIAGLQAELTPERYQPISPRGILVRLCDNIKVQALRADDSERALQIINRILTIAPEASNHWREAGILHARRNNVEAAVRALETFLAQSTEEKGRYAASQLLQELKEKLD